MAGTAHGGSQARSNPFARSSQSPSPAPLKTRPKSELITSPRSTISPSSHARNSSFTSSGDIHCAPTNKYRPRTGSIRNNSQPTSTFAPQFIKTEESSRRHERVAGIEGENDFSGKRYVWLRDPDLAFVKGWIVEELGQDRLLVQCEDGNVQSNRKSPAQPPR